MGIFKKIKGMFHKNETRETIEEAETNVSEIESGSNNQHTLYEGEILEGEDESAHLLIETIDCPSLLDIPDCYEIDDPATFAKLNDVIGKATKEAVHIGQTAGTYRVILSQGGSLVRSKAMDGAYRGFTMANGRINEQANLVSAVGKTSQVVGNIMNVASIVVGQYYFSDITNKLGKISSGVSDIKAELDIQYESEVKSLIEEVRDVTENIKHSLEDEEVRDKELDKIQNAKANCRKLLNHAEIELQRLVEKTADNTKKFIEIIDKIDVWNKFDEFLIKALDQINTLEYAFFLGKKKVEQCFNGFMEHCEWAISMAEKIKNYYDRTMELLGINPDNGELEKQNIFQQGAFALKNILAKKKVNKEVIKEKEKIPEATLFKIKAQQPKKEIKSQFKELFNQAVNIVIEHGKAYFLPEGEEFLKADKKKEAVPVRKKSKSKS